MNITLTFKSKLDLTGLKKRIHRMNIRNIGHGAALIRKISAQSIRYRADETKSSPVGTPPYTHTSRVSPYPFAPLKKSIRYEVEKENELAVIGVGHEGLLDIGYAHEIGGWYKMSRWPKARYFPKRPFMKPALNKVSPSLPKLWENSLGK